MRQTIEILALIIMMIFVAWSWYKNEKSAWRSLLYTVLTCFIFYLNAPNFLSIMEGTSPKNTFLSFPFVLYQELGTIYIVITNFLLAKIGMNLGQKKGDQDQYNNWKIKSRFDRFSIDATELKVIGRDLDFLLDNGNTYHKQQEKIRNIGNHAKLLCSWTNDCKLIELYHDLLNSGNQVRAYTSRDGIANLKGQIKTNERNEKSGLFVFKTSLYPNHLHKFISKVAQIPKIGQPIFHALDRSNLFEVTTMESSYLLEAVNQQFDKTYANALHPVIRCIALDLGGVYFDGNLDDFYCFLAEKYGIHMEKTGKDRLNIDDGLMFGAITIQDFITREARPREKTAELKDSDWNDILAQWRETWHPNEQIRNVIMDLHKFGYVIVPFSNLDRQNGEKYIRDHDLPECCTSRFFSYERKKSKPSEDAFDDFFKLAEKKGYIYKAYQILLIDDEAKNLEVASDKGWQTIYFYNDSSENAVEGLVNKLKQANILPENYSI